MKLTKVIIVIFQLLMVSSLVLGQTFEESVEVVFEEPAFAPDSNRVFTVVEESPAYPGGYEKLKEFLKQEFKYPRKLIKQKIEGRVFVQFVVLQDGQLDDFKVVKGLAPLLDAEACRVIKATGKWKPGKQRGKLVKVKFVLPVECKVPIKEKGKKK
jgi:protein TonB